MSEAIEAVVHFKVTVRSVEHEGYWTTKALETGIATVGATRGESEARNGEAHIHLIRRIKRLGLVALAEFMDSHGVDYEIGDPAHANRSVEQLPLAA